MIVSWFSYLWFSSTFSLWVDQSIELFTFPCLLIPVFLLTSNYPNHFSAYCVQNKDYLFISYSYCIILVGFQALPSQHWLISYIPPFLSFLPLPKTLHKLLIYITVFLGFEWFPITIISWFQERYFFSLVSLWYFNGFLKWFAKYVKINLLVYFFFIVLLKFIPCCNYVMILLSPKYI